MAMREGACRFGLWWVHVAWEGENVYRVRFLPHGEAGFVPPQIRQFLGGTPIDLNSLHSVATEEGAPYSSIYRAVRDVPYGKTATYGEIARITGTSPRLVGAAMKRNPTPLIVPCHRIVSWNGIGGFTPDVEIKRALIGMEKRKK